MADVTIKGLVSKAAPTSGDLLALWDEGSLTTKKLDALYYEPRDATILKNAAIGVTVSSQSHIHEGDDLNASGITDGYILTADGAGNAVWEANAGASNAFNDLTDVTITSPATGNIPRWNGGAWVNYPDSNYATAAQGSLAASALQNLTSVSIKTLSDVYTTMSPSQGQVLTYNTTNGWQAETPSTGAASALNDLSDVALDGTPGVDELLAYDGSNFVNQTAAEAGLATVTHLHEGTSIDATGVTSGYVLTADGVGNSAWLTPSSAGHAIEDEGSAVTARGTLNFVGLGVAVTDVGGKTTVTVNDMSVPETGALSSTIIVEYSNMSISTLLPTNSGSVRLHALSDCIIEFGDSTVVTDTSSMYFTKGTEVFGIPSGATHIAVKGMGSPGVLNVVGLDDVYKEQLTTNDMVVVGAGSLNKSIPTGTWVRLFAMTDTYINFGTSSVVADETSMFFEAGTEIIKVPSGATHIAARRYSLNGGLYITGVQ